MNCLTQFTKKVKHDPRLRYVLLFHGEQKLSFCVVHLESEEAVNPLFDRRNKITAWFLRLRQWFPKSDYVRGRWTHGLTDGMTDGTTDWLFSIKNLWIDKIKDIIIYHFVLSSCVLVWHKEKQKILHMWESIGHRPLWGRCPAPPSTLTQPT